jgi:hypothetical protein
MTNTNNKIARIEHINISVANADIMAGKLCEIFDWQVRWSGPAMDEGYAVHVGSEGENSSYFALYAPKQLVKNPNRGHQLEACLNHVGIVVDDLTQLEERLLTLGYKPFSHSDYGPCSSFYFHIDQRFEIEVIQYK